MTTKKPARKSPKPKAAPVPFMIQLTPAEIEELRADRRAAEAVMESWWGKVKTTSDLLNGRAKTEKS